MPTLLVTHPAFQDHVTPPGHPERPDRVRAVERALEHERFAALARVAAPLAGDELLTLAHDAAYVAMLTRAAPSEGVVALDADTYLSPGALEAARRGAGGAALAVDEVMSGRARNAFVASRPPGHHAEGARAMGFCLFANAVIAARHAQAAHGAARVAIVDFDVHHGNGTQAIVWDDASILYASTHQAPWYPGTGDALETGAHGTIVNAPLRAGDGSAAFREAMETAVLPRVEAFAPDLVVISAGFDAHAADPLGELNLTEPDFAWITRHLMDIADRHCGRRVVSVLEGGYDLGSLASSAATHVTTLMRG